MNYPSYRNNVSAGFPLRPLRPRRRYPYISRMRDLFDDTPDALPPDALPLDTMPPGAALLRGAALAWEAELLTALAEITAAAPFRHMVTPGGFTMSVGMTNCGPAGWVADRAGYRYAPRDPLTGDPWPAMPACFRDLAGQAAALAGYHGFAPDSCLINRYTPGTRLSLHQDKNERDLTLPIVSVSLGLSARFQFGGLSRTDPARVHRLDHGDVVVWGGPSRLRFHGILPLKEGTHPVLGRARINLTFRGTGSRA